MSGVDVAIKKAKGMANLARIAGVTRSAVSQWRTKGGVVPAPRRKGEPNRVEIIAKALDLPLHVLNPVVYRPVISPKLERTASPAA